MSMLTILYMKNEKENVDLKSCPSLFKSIASISYCLI